MFEWFTFAVRVNGVEFFEASLRSCEEPPADVDVLIRDRRLGSFALHEEFTLEIPEGGDERASWRQVSLDALKTQALEAAQKAGSELDRRPSAPGDHGEPSNRPMRRIFGRTPVDGDSSHIARADQALTGAGIRFQIVGGLDSRGRGACHLTLAVSSLVGARTCLRRAGFLESPESKYVLVDSRTGWKVRVLEGVPRRSR